jgi:hypothetical protein
MSRVGPDDEALIAVVRESLPGFVKGNRTALRWYLQGGGDDVLDRLADWVDQVISDTEKRETMNEKTCAVELTRYEADMVVTAVLKHGGQWIGCTEASQVEALRACESIVEKVEKVWGQFVAIGGIR